jgi:hypothetical protein
MNNSRATLLVRLPRRLHKRLRVRSAHTGEPMGRITARALEALLKREPAKEVRHG